jgi:flagellar hook-associated protein 2
MGIGKEKTVATSIDGLISGLDTTSLIDALMNAAAQPQTVLKSQAAGQQTTIQALQALNSKIAALATLATGTAKPATLDLHTATSSSSSVTVTAGAGAVDGRLDLTVKQTAQSQLSVTAAMTTWQDDPPVLTIVGADGKAHEVTAASTSVSDVVAAINAAGAGVTATRVAAGTDPVSGQPQYRVQFSSTDTGASAAFAVYRGTSAEQAAGTASDLFAEPGAATVRAAQDAQIALWSGSAAEQVISSADNTFENVMAGVSITVSAATTDPVAVTVARDDDGIAKAASALVDALNGVFALIGQQTSVTQTTDSSGKPSVRAGALTGEAVVRQATQLITSAATEPVDGLSPSTYGIGIQRDGTIAFDAKKLQAALAADPQKAVGALQAIAGRVQTAATGLADPYTGSITTQIKNDQSALGKLNDQISDWDTRLADRRTTLERTYANMEVALSKLQSQGNWLTSQLASLQAQG